MSQPSPPQVATVSLSVGERMLGLAVRAYPGNKALRSVGSIGSVREAWLSISSALGVTQWALAEALAIQLGIEVADLAKADPLVSGSIPESLARTQLVVALREDPDHRLRIASAAPFDTQNMHRVEFVANRKLRATIAPPDEIDTAISFTYSRAAELQGNSLGKLLFPEGEQKEGAPQASGTDAEPDESAVVRLARGLLIQSIEAGASDLHVQPYAGGGMVRIRVDGILRRLAFLPGPLLPALIRYMKANSGMDPTSDRVPQDGRLSIVRNKHDYDLRISVLPASRGERLVIRFLDQSRVYRLSGAGFSTAELRALRRMLTNTAGVILMTGPTGSGKTSTLYAMLSEINSIGVNIITVENPVEYRVTGIGQVEVNPKAGLTFASALRSILRQDPDVVLIGEIRDTETAEIAMQAALTGHLVLSTLHTNDALTAIPRLIDFGIEPSALGDALIGVVAQRLLRKLCRSCRSPTTDPLTADEQLFLDLTGERPAYRAVGCDACRQTGYAGRIPVIEAVEMTPELGQRITARDRNMASLRELVTGPLASIASTAARRVISGDTTPREAARVIGQRLWRDLALEFKRPLPRGVSLTVSHEDKASPDPVAVMFSLDPAFAEQVAQALATEHFRVVSASSVEEARASVQGEEDAAVLVVDLDPGPDGDPMALLVNLRVALAWSRIPALPIVRASDEGVCSVLEEHGVSNYLRKPVEPAEIAARVRGLLKG